MLSAATLWLPFAKRYTCSSFNADDWSFSTKGCAHRFGSLEKVKWDSPFDAPEYSNWAYEFSYFYFLLPHAQENAESAVHVAAELLGQLERVHAPGLGHLHAVWSPIRTANRVFALLALLASARNGGVDLSSKSARVILRHIAICERILARTVETYLGYNHAAFGLVALCLAQLVTSGSGRKAGRTANKAMEAVEGQVLPDGFQAERSPSYHIHVLLLATTLAQAGVISDKERIGGLIEKMRRALDAVVHPDGEIALFNDCAMQDSIPPADVGWTESHSARSILAEAGYGKLQHGRYTVIFDSGKMGPDDVIGHGHADFLSCEISVDKRRLIVDPGVLATAKGPKRDRTRSSQSHNGPTFKDMEPAEFFGAWRVGHRGAAAFIDDDELPNRSTLELAGQAYGWKEISGRSARYIAVDGEGVTIIDAWHCAGLGKPQSRFTIPSTWVIEEREKTSCRLRCTETGASVFMSVTNGAIVEIGEAEWHPLGAMVSSPANYIDVTPVGFSMRIAFSVGKRSEEREDALESWLLEQVGSNAH